MRKRPLGKLQQHFSKSAIAPGDPWHLRASILALTLCSGCKAGTEAVAPVDATKAVTRSAQSFVHCIEQTGPQCVGQGELMRGFGSLSTLAWLEDGSPLTLLSLGDSVLAARHDTDRSQGQFVSQINGVYSAVRGADCTVQHTESLENAVGTLKVTAVNRLEGLQMWPSQRAEVVDMLAKESLEALPNGYIAAIECSAEPWRFYLVTAEHGGKQAVVGMMRVVPKSIESMMGQAPLALEQDNAQARAPRGYALQDDSMLHPWIKVPAEEF